jgi:hypothetical protein
MSKMTVILIVVGCFLSCRHKTVVYEQNRSLPNYSSSFVDICILHPITNPDIIYCITAVSCYVIELTCKIVQTEICLPRLWEGIHSDCVTN